MRVPTTIAASAATLALAFGAVGFASADPGPNGHNDFGLCTAYFAGSENGREHKHQAPPFVALQEAAGATTEDSQEQVDQKVADWCADKSPGGEKSGGNGKGGKG